MFREIKVYKMFKDPNIIEIPLDVYPEQVAQTICNYVTDTLRKYS